MSESNQLLNRKYVPRNRTALAFGVVQTQCESLAFTAERIG